MDHFLSIWEQFLKSFPELYVQNFPKIPKTDSSPEELASDEVFWQEISSHFYRNSRIINLNNGSASSNPIITENAFVQYYKLQNHSPAYYIYKVMEQGREVIRKGLAELINADPNEIALSRNTTEAINNIIFGLDLEEGDEVVASIQDFTKCNSSWKQREARHKIKMKWVNLNGAEETDDEIIAKYLSAFSDKTKVVHLTYTVNWNGQILPVKTIINEAKKRGIQVILDGAHSLGLLDIDVKELGCDYFASALHKWIMGPIPSGMLYVHNKHISKIWPLASALSPQSENIRKFEELSLPTVPHIIGLGHSLHYHSMLGRDNKSERLRHLRRYLTDQIINNDKISINTPLEEYRCCALLNVNVKGWTPADLETVLLDKYKIHVSPILTENMQGIRIASNIYTTKEQLDLLAKILNGL